MTRHSSVGLSVLLFLAMLSSRAYGLRFYRGGQLPEEREFKRLATQLAEQRLSGTQENQSLQEQALAILDRIVCDTIGHAAAFDLDSLNARLARMVTQDPPVGENYQVVRLEGGGVYALVANFSQSGPAAVRLYSQREVGRASGRPGHLVKPDLVARIDGAAYPDFFDEGVELVPVTRQNDGGSPPGRAGGSAPGQAIFVTVSGRGDDLQTGAFMAWRFAAGKLEKLWSSEILQQSSYEAAGGEFRLTFCAEPDEDRPRICRRMAREKYAWREGAWKRLEQADVPLAKP